MKKILSALLGLFLLAPAAYSQTAPDFTLPDLNRQQISLSDYRGQVVVVDFWATWCGPCQVEMPHLQAIYDDLHERGVQVLAVSVDEARTASRVKPHIMSRGFTFPVLLDTSTEVVARYNPQMILPYVVVVDQSGKIVYRHSGYSAGDEVELRSVVMGLLP